MVVFLLRQILIPYDIISLASSYFALSMDSEVPLRLIHLHQTKHFGWCYTAYGFLCTLITGQYCLIVNQIVVYIFSNLSPYFLVKFRGGEGYTVPVI